MDGHINKPVDPNRFFDVLVEVLNKKKSSATTEIANEVKLEKSSLTSLDKPKALQAVMGDEALYNDLLNDFLALEDELNALKQAIDTRDFPSIARNAHIFTTALRYIGAFTLAELTSSIEIAIKNNEHKTAGNFGNQLETLHNALLELREKVKKLVS
jgi:HPt (histidine-containing phosphotransfer) domain-containing protein